MSFGPIDYRRVSKAMNGDPVGSFGPVDYDRLREAMVGTAFAVRPADVIVYRDEDEAVAVDRFGKVVARSTDHAEVIQKAIDHLPDIGGKIVLSGTFDIYKTISLDNKKNVVVEGLTGVAMLPDDWATKLIVKTDIDILFSMKGSQGIALRNLALVSDKPRDTEAIHIERESAESPMPEFNMVENVVFKWLRGGVRIVNCGGGTKVLSIRRAVFNDTPLRIEGVAGLHVEDSMFRGAHRYPNVQVSNPPPDHPLTGVGVASGNSRIVFVDVHHYIPSNRYAEFYFTSDYNTSMTLISPYFEVLPQNRGLFANEGSGAVSITMYMPRWVGDMREWLGSRGEGAGGLFISIVKEPIRRTYISIPIGTDNTYGDERVFGPMQRLDPFRIYVGGSFQIDEVVTVSIVAETANGDVKEVVKTFTSTGWYALDFHDLQTLYSGYGCIKKLRIRAKTNMPSTNVEISVHFVEW